MDPHVRDEVEETILQDMIRDGGDDVTSLFMNPSGEGDERNRRDGSGDEGAEQDRRDGSGEGEGDDSDRTLNITNSGEVYIY